MKQKLISMTEKEIEKYDVIKNLLDNKINGKDASKQLSLSDRQIRRLKKIATKSGIEGFAHKSRGKESNRKLDPNIIKMTEKYLKEKYHFCGPTFAQEKLEENEGIKISKELVRTIMTNLSLWTPKPRKKSKIDHVWRPRKDNYGEMQQFDRSYHIWFGDEEYCLLLAVDDATGKITHAKFDINESTEAVFKFWLEYFDLHGLPLSIYLDKNSTYKVNHKNAVHDKEMITQFERAMREIGVMPIVAHSAQAKGRVERMNGTLQDRLVKELRLENIDNPEEANQFLKNYKPIFNKKFAVVPSRRKNLHKKIRKEVGNKLDQTFSIQKERVVNNDYTIRFEKQYFQLDKIQTTTVYKKDRVIVEKHLNNEIKIRKRDCYLNHKLLPKRPEKEIDIKLPALTKKENSDYKPPIDHPWRSSFIYGKIKKDNQFKT